MHYYVENIAYEHSVFSTKGWMFGSTDAEENEIQQTRLVVICENGKAVESRIEFHARQDVANVYGLSYDQVGFFFQEHIKVPGHSLAYLSFCLHGEERQLLLSALDETDSLETSIRMTHPDLKGYYCSKNFQLVRRKYNSYRKDLYRSVDLIIPVYNGYSYLTRLLSSIYQTELDMRVIVVNDCSTDERVRDFFHAWSQKYPNLVYIENESNQGFVKSVNKGLRLAENDVALLNTDIEVPPYWLERLMLPIFMDRKVASATPYTNCGTLCSFPEIGKNNPVFNHHTVEFADAVFCGFEPAYTEMPTGVGFCMGMNKDVISQIGLFDEESFSKGYGEENDWCQRAIHAGYKNVQVENLFVYHKHGGSFLSEEKEKLLEENTKKLIQKHPHYMENTAKYFAWDLNKVFRKYALFLCLAQEDAQTVIFFNHALGGGANAYLTEKKKAAIEKEAKVMEFRYDAYENLYQLEIQYKDYSIKLYGDSFKEIYNELRLTRIDEIYINELVIYPDLYEVLEQILLLKKQSHASLTMLLHDYLCICPTVNLLSKDGIYCGMSCANQKCLKNNPFLCDAAYTDIKEWRIHWKAFLQQCETVIAFSNDTKERMERIYGKLKNICVSTHQTDRMLPVEKKYKSTDTVNIAVMGVLSRHKGLYIIKEMLAEIEQLKLPVRIIVIGTCEEEIENRQNVVVTGKYTREQLPGFMYLYDIDVVFLASVWPETFSYTTEEAIKMQMPTAVFDLGAPTERVKKYKKGIVIQQINAKAALQQIWEYVPKEEIIETRIRKKILFLVEYVSFSSRYRVDHFRESMAVQGFQSEVVLLQKLETESIADYEVISFYRCTDTAKISHIAKHAKKHGILLFYDLDDFIFDYGSIQEQSFLQDEEYLDFETYAKNIRTCMGFCDVLTTSTEHLADAMREQFPEKKIIVCRNAASMEMQLLSEIAVDHKNALKEEKKKIVLGYFSGSKTHNQDWKLIENCVLEMMKRNEQVELLFVGVLEITDKFLTFGNRVKKLPFVRWQKLPELICHIDINLMPLEDYFFQWCKSENKWLEAGLVGVVTIASYNPELAEVLRDGYDVVLCKDQLEWENKLEELIGNPKLRSQIGRHAKEEVYRTHLVTCEENFAEVINEMGLVQQRS